MKVFKSKETILLRINITNAKRFKKTQMEIAKWIDCLKVGFSWKFRKIVSTSAKKRSSVLSSKVRFVYSVFGVPT